MDNRENSPDDLRGAVATLLNSGIVRLIGLVPFVVMGLAAIIFGIVMYFQVDASQRQDEAKLQSISSGQVQPETLTVVRKYISAGMRHGSDWPHVVFRTSRQPELNCSATQEFYDAVNPGSAAIGYYFPDGYFIPRNHGEDAGIAKWLFLGVGVLFGGGMLAYVFTRVRPRPLE